MHTHTSNDFSYIENGHIPYVEENIIFDVCFDYLILANDLVYFDQRNLVMIGCVCKRLRICLVRVWCKKISRMLTI